jgi:cholesterol oxidase
MKEVADKLGRGGQFCYPNIAVDFSAPAVAHRNKFGAEQSGCTYCGECDIGCNVLAKNTLDLNYLALAEQRGADVAPLSEAVRIERDGAAWRVMYKEHAAGGAQNSIAARAVFLCAGAVNSTELLLRCRDQFGTLPDLSDRLGQGYSGNGDFLAFAFDTAAPAEPSNGPTITTGIVYDRGAGDDRVWFIFEEGGHPREIGALLQLLNPREGWLKAAANLSRDELGAAFGAAARGRLGAGVPAHDDTAVFLAMGRDRANGILALEPLTHALKVSWDVASNMALYDAEQRLAADVAGAMGGVAAFNPFWRRFRLPVSVHNLGGCVMADDAARGVTDANGEVFNYSGLYVLDGAALPAATGVNPSHTIAAVAERNVEAAIRTLTGNPAWRAPEGASARRIGDPVSKIVIPAGGVMAPQTQTIGLSFTETMKGFLQKGAVPGGQSDIAAYVAAERAGQQANTYMEFTLTITIPNLDQFLADSAHAGVANGSVRVDGFTPVAGVPVNGGLFNLFVDTGRLYERQMLYALPFAGADGQPYLLDGFKEVRDDGRFDVWGATSTLYTVIRAGHERTGRVMAAGILHILVADFMHQLTTFTVSGTDDPARKAEALSKFGRMFMGTLWDVFARPRLG